MENIQVSYETHSSMDYTFSWTNTTKQINKYMFMIENASSHFELTTTFGSSQQTYTIPIKLRPGCNYTVTVRALKSRGNLGSQTVAIGHASFRTVFTREELRQLMRKATAVIRQTHKPLTPCKYLFRNKPHEYFSKILNFRRHIMEVYKKDFNGDPASPINGQIDGLFFATGPDPKTGLPPATSHFGPMRLNVPTGEMFRDEYCNIYFADFYCVNRAHYVTLVMTEKGSSVDSFCKSKLIKVENKSNPFFVIQKNGEVKVTTAVWIEIFYTKDINLDIFVYSHNAFFSVVNSTGTSTPDGWPKNPNCKVCNLYRGINYE